MDCLLVDKCINNSDYEGCDNCQYNRDAYLQDNFEFNHMSDNYPTDEELDAALEYAE